MGQLLKNLRKQVEISQDFDLLLQRALDSRNTFVHNFSIEFNLATKDGISGAIKYLLKTQDDLEEAINVLNIILLAFARDQDNVPIEDYESDWRRYGNLDKLETVYLAKSSKAFNK